MWSSLAIIELLWPVVLDCINDANESLLSFLEAEYAVLENSNICKRHIIAETIYHMI